MTELSNSEIVLAGLQDEMVLNGDSQELAGLTQTGASANRKNFIQRIKQFDKKTREGLKNGTLQLVDITIFSMRNVALGTVEIFATDDDIVKGVRNIAKRKLQAERPMLLTHVGVIYSTADIATGFAPAQYTDKIKRSELTFEYDSFKVFERELVGLFTNNMVNGYAVNDTYGLVALDNPKVLLPEKEILLNLDTTETAGAVMGVLKGVSVRPFSKA